MDLFEKLLQNRGHLGELAKVSHGYFAFPKLEGEVSNRMTFRGKEVIAWSINNYLGLSNHPEVRKVDAEAAAKYGLGYPMGARMMSGNTALHEELEEKLAKFEKKEDAILLNFGYQGMTTTIDALVDRRDVIVYDSDSHACIMDGVRLHMGKRYVFEHNDMASLEKQLQRATKLIKETGGAILVITEGVFGMVGDQGYIKEIVDLKSKYEFRLLVDDAHGFGTLGKTGAGTGEEQGCQDGIDIYFSTFAKSMASIGAFIASDEQVIDYIRYNSRSQVYAKSLPMPLVAGGIKRLEMLQTMPELKEKLWENTKLLQDGLRARGFNLGKSNTCVTPVHLRGSLAEAANLAVDLRENHKVFCSIVMYPIVPKGEILLRMIPTAVHTKQDIEETLEGYSAVYKKLKNGEYSKETFASADLSYQ